MRESTRRDPFVFLGGTLTTERPGHLTYQPALDGLRAVAVAAVIAYHLGYPWARGGYLGVDTFFVFSGYLITSLLLTEGRAEGRIDLPAFWIRRARRLLPALLLVLAVIAVYAAWSTPTDAQAALRSDGLFALFYSANWHFIADNNSYFDLFAAPSLLEHTWSLAIEEQFYAGVATRRRGVSVPRTGPPRHARRDRSECRARICRAHGRARRRPHEGVLRHRHSSALSAHRRVARGVPRETRERAAPRVPSRTPAFSPLAPC